MSDEQKDEKVGLDEQVYDPLFVTLLVAQVLVHHPPASSLEWVQTFRSIVFSLLIRCLSTKDENIREASLGLLARVWKSVQVRVLPCHEVLVCSLLVSFRICKKSSTRCTSSTS
jgi:nucleolar pre-ribosomal-associated protein 1